MLNTTHIRHKKKEDKLYTLRDPGTTALLYLSRGLITNPVSYTSMKKGPLCKIKLHFAACMWEVFYGASFYRSNLSSD